MKDEGKMTTDLPKGFRWATPDEYDQPDAIIVQRTADGEGNLYLHGESHVAVPTKSNEALTMKEKAGKRISVYSSISDVELATGMKVLVHLDDSGVFVGVVDHFEDDDAVAVIMATRDPVRDVFPKGYRIGQAHWKSNLTKIAEDSVWPETKW